MLFENKGINNNYEKIYFNDEKTYKPKTVFYWIGWNVPKKFREIYA
jgi:hypothetical protein